jgi:hypothetical protein
MSWHLPVVRAGKCRSSERDGSRRRLITGDTCRVTGRYRLQQQQGPGAQSARPSGRGDAGCPPRVVHRPGQTPHRRGASGALFQMSGILPAPGNDDPVARPCERDSRGAAYSGKGSGDQRDRRAHSHLHDKTRFLSAAAPSPPAAASYPPLALVAVAQKAMLAPHQPGGQKKWFRASAGHFAIRPWSLRPAERPSVRRARRRPHGRYRQQPSFSALQFRSSGHGRPGSYSCHLRQGANVHAISDRSLAPSEPPPASLSRSGRHGPGRRRRNP